MKALLSSFLQFLNQITKDKMLLVICMAPFIYGLLFKIGIPKAENALTSYLGVSDVFAPYYLAFDLFFSLLTCYMFCFVATMVILGEIDDNVSNYFAVTPIGKGGYIISRLGFPTIISVMISCLLLPVFSLTKLSFFMVFVVSILSGITSLIASILIITFSENKVEGMALTKLTALNMLGIPIPFFITGYVQYFAFFLPTFWLAKVAVESNYSYILGAILSSTVWIFALYRKFVRKVL